MTKIVCVGDIHVSDRAPASATHEYTDDIIAMLKWVADYANEIDADAVVWAGDVFHHKSPGRNSHELVLKMIDVVKYHQVPLWCVTGNHDISNGIVDSVHEKQPLGVLYAAGLQELVGWHHSLPLFGVPWRETWTEPGDAWKALAGWRCDDGVTTRASLGLIDLSRALAVTHAPIYPPGEAEKQLFDLVPLRGTGGLSEAMGNRGFLYYGHIHEDHGIFEVEGVTYANMGAISRGSLHEYNLERKIKVAVWEDPYVPGLVYPEGERPSPTFTEVDVPHKPASEAFRLAEVMEEREDKMSLESFLSEVGQRTLDIVGTGSVIEHIRTRQDVPEGVRNRAIQLIEEVS